MRRITETVLVMFSAAIMSLPAMASETATPITESTVVPAIVSDLAFFTPNVTIGLNGEKMSPGIADLERAGILKQLARNPDGTLSLLLTNNGERIAAERGWSVRYNVLTITTGYLQYGPGSYHAQQADNSLKVTYLWRYVPNGNALYLLRLGPLSDWPQSMYPGCLSPAGSAISTANQRTVLFWPDGLGGWRPTNVPSEHFPGCAPRPVPHSSSRRNVDRLKG